MSNTHVEVEHKINGMRLKSYPSEFLNKLILMTNLCEASSIVGEGGYGKVYKAPLPNSDKQVAIKVLENKDIVEERETFMAEVETVSNTNHKNIIKLIGYCFEPNLKALVYEYMEKGSLDKYLYNKSDISIDWKAYYRIAIEIADGLSYFHESSSEQIIHYDIKAANVVLDNNLSPKIIDFGLAKLYKRDEMAAKVSKTRGTPCYTAPELNSNGITATSKCDVYSFGLLLFEILWKRRIFEKQDGVYFPKQVWDSFHSQELERLFNNIGITEENREKAKILAKVALLCINDKPHIRPSMFDVLLMLREIKPVLPEPSLPSTYWETSNSSTTSASNNRMSEDDTSGSSGSNTSWRNQDPGSISTSLKDNALASSNRMSEDDTSGSSGSNISRTNQDGLNSTWKKFTYEDGTCYEGTWKNGVQHGQGKLTYTNGAYYEGTFKNDLEDGQGRLVLANGNEYICEWKNGDLLRKTSVSSNRMSEDDTSGSSGSNISRSKKKKKEEDSEFLSTSDLSKALKSRAEELTEELDEERLREAESMLKLFERKNLPHKEKVFVYMAMATGLFTKEWDEKSNDIMSILQLHQICPASADIRNISDRLELKKILGIPMPKIMPALFVKGRFIGGAEEVKSLEQTGKLKILLYGIPKN